MTETWAVFLDRDGVLNEPVWDPEDQRPESPLRAADVVLVPGAAQAVAQLAAAGARVAVVSNQPAAAKGKATADDLRAVHERVVALLAEAGARPDVWRYCWHTSGDGCPCRKPAPGMLLDVAAEFGVALPACWMVGDTDADVGAGRAAGCRTVLVEHPASAHRRSRDLEPDVRVERLADAVRVILDTR